MGIRNHQLPFRPLRPGTYIYNPQSGGGGGTLGFIATSNGADRWIVSCHHIIGRRNMSVCASSEPIFQPTPSVNNTPIATTDPSRCDLVLDCAGAACVAGTALTNDILGLGRIKSAKSAAVGMLVKKSGAATGITDAMVAMITGANVTIEPLAQYPNDYAITESGDSGAAWVEVGTNAFVALNIGPTGMGQRGARAISATCVLASLRLKLP